MKSIWALVLSVLFTASVGHAAQFKITVIYPDGEEKYYRIEKETTFINLGKSNWACSFKVLAPDKTKTHKVFTSQLFCLAPNEKDGVGIKPTCISDLPKTDVALHLVEDKGRTFYRVAVTCTP